MGGRESAMVMPHIPRKICEDSRKLVAELCATHTALPTCLNVMIEFLNNLLDLPDVGKDTSASCASRRLCIVGATTAMASQCRYLHHTKTRYIYQEVEVRGVLYDFFRQIPS